MTTFSPTLPSSSRSRRSCSSRCSWPVALKRARIACARRHVGDQLGVVGEVELAAQHPVLHLAHARPPTPNIQRPWLYSRTALPGGVIGNSPGSGPGIQGSSPCPAVSRWSWRGSKCPGSRCIGVGSRHETHQAQRHRRRRPRKRGRRGRHRRPERECSDPRSRHALVLRAGRPKRFKLVDTAPKSPVANPQSPKFRFSIGDKLVFSAPLFDKKGGTRQGRLYADATVVKGDELRQRRDLGGRHVRPHRRQPDRRPGHRLPSPRTRRSPSLAARAAMRALAAMSSATTKPTTPPRTP